MTDLLAWLQESSEYPKIYWKERDSETAFAAVGADGDSLSSYSWRFFDSPAAPHFNDFLLKKSICPRVEISASAKSSLSWNKEPIKKISLTPNKKGWIALVQKALSQIEKGALDKCVLARECKIEFASPPDPWLLTAALQKEATNAYILCLQPTSRSAFISATPETLFSRSANLIRTEALASTRRCKENKRFTKKKTSKDQREFRLVEESIVEALKPYAEAPLSFSPQSVRTTSGLKHLYSRLETTLSSPLTDDQLLDLLHPTAALLGYSKENALDFLRQNEPFARGLYGAPIGRITEEKSTWAVGIRSCLLFESTARLYSGAGVVAGSDPNLEWEELNHKLCTFERILSIVL